MLSRRWKSLWFSDDVHAERVPSMSVARVNGEGRILIHFAFALRCHDTVPLRECTAHGCRYEWNRKCRVLDMYVGRGNGGTVVHGGWGGVAVE